MKARNLSSSLPSDRLPEIDFLRGVAILLVLGRHALWVPTISAGLSGAVFRAWMNFGWIGVDLFFVLSGFLVGGLLIREGLKFGSIAPGAFLARRGLRIYPAFYAFLFLSLGICRAIGFQFATWPKGFFSELFLVQNYFPGLWPQTWSLAVEEHFYLLLLALLFFLIKQNPSKKDPFAQLPKIVLIVNTLILLGRIIFGYGLHLHWSILDFQTQWRLDSLLFGVLLSYGIHQHMPFMTKIREMLRPWRWIGFSVLFGPCLILNLNKDPYVSTIGLTSLYLGFGWVLIDLLLSQETTKLRLLHFAPMVPWIGRDSYSIYLWHFTVYYILVAFVHRKLGWSPPLFLESLAYMMAAIFIGMIMSWLIDQPVLRWRNRLIPARTKAM